MGTLTFIWEEFIYEDSPRDEGVFFSPPPSSDLSAIFTLLPSHSFSSPSDIQFYTCARSIIHYQPLFSIYTHTSLFRPNISNHFIKMSLNNMKVSAILAFVASVAQVSAHGFVDSINVGGTT